MALEMTVERSIERKAFGKQLSQHGMRESIARSLIEIDQARLSCRSPGAGLAHRHGPDEVHLDSVARHEVKAGTQRLGSSAPYLLRPSIGRALRDVHSLHLQKEAYQ